ncbi:dTDP-4-dehydrorhamnose reductase [Micromonospora fluostatini]|uniref:dTDP-4-dehydrorhamnose reductase n=1 Tax=Micromonospora sp. JCM 30529 TaxID=3421643 RepID=UPI003D173349
MTRWLVTGAAGMLGRDLVAALGRLDGASVTAADRAALDVTDRRAVTEAVGGHDVVVNAAAWTDVDGAERAEDAATAVNGTAVAHLARACAGSGAVLVQVSTDYVFAGTTAGRYPEDGHPGPVNAYGRSKLVGEEAVRRLLPQRGYVVRTAWLYGEHGPNVVATMLDRAARVPHLDVVDDLFGQPTWSVALAAQLVALGRAARAGQAPPGTYHGTSAGETSWYGLARALFAHAGLDPARVRPVSRTRFPRPAVRPVRTVLGHAGWATAGLPPQGHWRAQVRAALATPGFAALARAARQAEPGLGVTRSVDD